MRRRPWLQASQHGEKSLTLPGQTSEFLPAWSKPINRHRCGDLLRIAVREPCFPQPLLLPSVQSPASPTHRYAHYSGRFRLPKQGLLFAEPDQPRLPLHGRSTLVVPLHEGFWLKLTKLKLASHVQKARNIGAIAATPAPHRFGAWVLSHQCRH